MFAYDTTQFNGGPGNDSATQLYGDAIFRGNLGHDTIEFLSQSSRFLGGPGNDQITRAMYQDPVFRGGSGRDYVNDLSGGMFNAGPGYDDVRYQHGGVFRGNKGNDAVNRGLVNGTGLRAGEFNGGPGTDKAGVCANNTGTTISVENKNDLPTC